MGRFQGHPYETRHPGTFKALTRHPYGLLRLPKQWLAPLRIESSVKSRSSLRA